MLKRYLAQALILSLFAIGPVVLTGCAPEEPITQPDTSGIEVTPMNPPPAAGSGGGNGARPTATPGTAPTD